MNVHISSKLIAIGAGLGLIMLSPILAYAGCSQSDLAGTWDTYSMSVDSSGLLSPQTDYCKVRINSSGSIVASKSSCKVRSWPGLLNGNIAGGSIKVNSSCKLKGSVTIIGTDVQAIIKLEYGTAAKDKRTFSLVGYDTINPTYITHLTGVKR